jgi:VanW like protein
VLPAVSFIDGIVIPAGERLVFDDIARTWDYRDDPSYVLGKATSVRGFVHTRGGGVCTVSTAVWRAALEAGLRTDRRQSHHGLMEPGDPGLDATNTLIIANDSSEAVVVHVWLDDEPFGPACSQTTSWIAPHRYPSRDPSATAAGSSSRK